jgi:ribonuclease-3
LSLLTVEFIYKKFPNIPEGKIAKIKSHVVSEFVLSQIADSLELSEILILGKGERDTGGANKKSNLANLLEALLGAIYLDMGLETTRIWFTPYLQKYVNDTKRSPDTWDSKTRLQEYAQKKYKVLPVYQIISESGADHDKVYTISVSLPNINAIGTGKSKRRAEKEAAKILWDKVNPKKDRRQLDG